jgi:alanine racemase
VAQIDGAAIATNVAHLRTRLSDSTELCAVVKADGYGHGMLEAARAALVGGASRLAVVTVQEAAVLVAAEPGVPILMLGPLDAAEIDEAVASGAELTAWDADQVKAIAAAAEAAGTISRLHVKLDTGMGRFGARQEQDALGALAVAAQSPATSAVAVWTHFATADELGDDYFSEQLERFTAFVEVARREHPQLLAHAANSAALLREKASHFDFVRPGIAIYGLDPFGRDAAEQGLRPALSLTSYVASLRDLSPGDSIGYGRRFTAHQETRIATLPIGYGDGWRRILSDNCEVLIGGRRYNQRGTVSMDSIMVEVGAGSEVPLGATATLIGRDGDEEITTEDVAVRAQTINYEITCGLTGRTVRHYEERD